MRSKRAQNFGLTNFFCKIMVSEGHAAARYFELTKARDILIQALLKLKAQNN